MKRTWWCVVLAVVVMNVVTTLAQERLEEMTEVIENSLEEGDRARHVFRSC